MSKIQKAYKFRIYPNAKQIETIDKSIRVSNFVYNYFLSLQKEIDEVLIMYGLTNKDERKKWKSKKGVDDFLTNIYGLTDDNERKKWINKNKLWFDKYSASNLLTKLSKIGKYDFLGEVESTIRTYSLKNLDSAFSKIKDGSGFPKFKSKKNKKNSFTTQCQRKSCVCFKEVKSKGNKYSIKLRSSRKSPLGNVKSVIHMPEFIDKYNNDIIKINSFTISIDASGSYHISFQVEEETFMKVEKKLIVENRSIGIDLGIKRAVTTSDYNDFDSDIFGEQLSSYKDSLDELKRLSIIVSNKRANNKEYKESGKYKRVLNKLSKLHVTVSNRRKYLQHKISSNLINMKDVDTYILEDLNIKGMTKRSGKGLSNRKSGLNRSMLDVGLGEITRQLNYKANWKGKNVETVCAKYTSQRCNSCGHIEKESRISQSEFKCTKCGNEDNADFNAAKNIKDKFFGK